MQRVSFAYFARAAIIRRRPDRNSRFIPRAITKCVRAGCFHAACSEGLDSFATHVEIVRQSTRLELASDDEIEHLARIGVEQGRSIRPARERASEDHVENLFDGLPRRAPEMQAMKGQRPTW
jgi:hypothetical protein